MARDHTARLGRGPHQRVHGGVLRRTAPGRGRRRRACGGITSGWWANMPGQSAMLAERVLHMLIGPNRDHLACRGDGRLARVAQEVVNMRQALRQTCHTSKPQGHARHGGNSWTRTRRVGQGNRKRTGAGGRGRPAMAVCHSYCITSAMPLHTVPLTTRSTSTCCTPCRRAKYCRSLHVQWHAPLYSSTSTFDLRPPLFQYKHIRSMPPSIPVQAHSPQLAIFLV